MDFNALLRLVSDEKRARIARFHFLKDAQNTLLADLLARREIRKRTGLENSHLTFGVNEYGKPFLQNDPNLHFNISHSGATVALATDSQPVGIDIERIKPIRRNLADRFFASDEAAFIAAQSDEASRCHAFYEIWTKKESRVKFEGKGFSMPLNSFSVLNPQDFFYHRMRDDADSICHVCTKQAEKPSCEHLCLTDIRDVLLDERQ